jgi:hypothetical protein
MVRAEAVKAFLRLSNETLSHGVPPQLLEGIEKWSLNPCSHASESMQGETAANDLDTA